MENPSTHFAPPERASEEEITAQRLKLAGTRAILQLLDSFPEAAMILNAQRQIVFANDKLAGMLNVPRDRLLACRPGETVNCVHAHDCAAGCGTSESCVDCGAAQAIWESQKTNTVQVRECRIVCHAGHETVSLDLRVWATPLTDVGNFIVFAIHDITDEKRRGVLERMFFHDVLNTAGGLRGLMEVFLDEARGEPSDEHMMAKDLADQLVEEIQSQRDLSAAERGDLVPVPKEVDVEELLTNLCKMYAFHTVAQGKTLRPPRLSGAKVIRTDRALLSRVVGNLIKNALEASSPGQAVQVFFENHGLPVFSVHNEAVMPPSVQHQIFQRSFSTKEGPGRGIGTYSVKLLTERYLNGTVAFTSSEGRGTTFTVTLHES